MKNDTDRNQRDREYIAFMCNPDNEYKCKDCPERMEHHTNCETLPCGQYHCWVTLHIQHNAGW